MKKNLFAVVCIAVLTISNVVFAQTNALGDVDGDSSVTTTDSMLISNYIVGNPVPDYFDEVAADANCDGTVDAVDLGLTVKASVGIYEELFCWQLGDVNGDGEVTYDDANAVMDYIAGNPAQTFIAPMADVNGDGDIDTQDATDIVIAVQNGTPL